MCIIAAKPAGVAMPSPEQIEVMWHNNPDGGGIMYVKDGSVYIDKGYMCLADYMQRLDELRAQIDLDAAPVVLHFRIASAGGVCAPNCHPFPLTSSEKIIRQLHCKTTVGIAHNGNIHGYGNSQLSDTMQYIMLQLAPMSKVVPQFWRNRYCLEMIINAMRGSWLVLLAADGSLTTLGDFFIERDGIYYSNKTFQEKLCLSDIYQNGVHTDGLSLLCEPGPERFSARKPLVWAEDTAYQIRGGSADARWLFDRDGSVYRWDDALDGAIPAPECAVSLPGAAAFAYPADLAVMTDIYA